MDNCLLKTENLTKIYKTKRGEVLALSEVTLDFPNKGFVFINGISGSGKTTLMNLLAGIDKPTTGKICYNGIDITSESEGALAAFRNLDVGLIFQTYNLFDDMTVKQNLLLPLSIQGIDAESSKKAVEDILNYVNLSGFENRKCTELSAGQRQRIAIARALIKNPKIILADEAMGNLDPLNTESMLQLFNEIAKERLVILVSHDPIAAENYGDLIISLSKGKVIETIDNSKVKNLHSQSYSIQIESDGKEETLPFRTFDFKNAIVKRAAWNGLFFEEMYMKMRIVHENDDESNKENLLDFQNVNAKPKRFSLKDTLSNSVYLLRKRVFRTFLIVFLISFVCMLFHMSVIICTNDYDYALSKYIEKKGYDMLMVEQILSLENDKVRLSNGKQFVSVLDEITNNNTVKCVSTDLMIPESGELRYVALLYADTLNSFSHLQIEGEWPQKENQVVLSQSAAKEMHMSIGDSLYIFNMPCIICGFYNGKISDSITESVIVSSDFRESYIESMSQIHMYATDVTLSASVSNYVSGGRTIGNASQLKSKADLCWGRLPQASNELLISDSFAEELGDFGYKGDIITEYRLPNLHDPQNEGKYDALINLYDYMGKKIEIVGIYDSQKNSDFGEILVNSDVFYSIKSDFLKYYSFDECFMTTDSDLYERLVNMSSNHIEISDDSYCSRIYSIKHITSELKHVFVVVLLVFISVILCFQISFLAYNVKDQARKIGIFRAIGVNKKDIERIFLINSFLISALSIAVSFVCTVFVTGMLNAYINRFAGMACDVFFIHFGILGINSILIIFLSLIITIIPLKNMVHKQAILLLNEPQ